MNREKKLTLDEMLEIAKQREEENKRIYQEQLKKKNSDK